MKSIKQFSVKKLLLLCIISFTVFNATAQMLLDGKGSPTFAYSTRQLLSSYTGPALQVRRVSDNQMVDVNFDSKGIVSLASPVIPTTSGATLGDFVSGTDAFVTIWYDQAKNADAVQSTPQILKSGKITIDASGVATLTTALLTTSSYPITSVVDQTITIDAGTSTTSPILVGATLSGVGIPSGTVVTAIGTRGGATPNYTYPITISSSHTATVGGTMAAVTNMFVGDLLMETVYPYGILGTVTSINSTTSLTLSNFKAVTSINWGQARQPRLTENGKIITLPNGMPALRFNNAGSSTSNSLLLNTFNNDGGSAYLSGMQNFNVYTVFNRQGNFSNTQGILCTQSPTGANAGKFQSTLESGLNFNTQFSNNTTKAISTTYANNTTNCSRIRISGGNMGNSFADNTALGTVSTIPGVVGGVTAPLDNSSIYIYGYTTSARAFQGLSPEMIFYGSTTAVDNDQYAATILADQLNIFKTQTTAINKIESEFSTPISIYFLGKEKLIIKGELGVGATAMIFDITGKILFKTNLKAGFENSFNLKLNAGIYIVKVKDGARLTNSKVIVE